MRRVRIVSWILIVAAAVTALGVFMPVIEAPLGGHVVSKRETLSLRGTARDRKRVRQLLAAYRGSHATKLGGALLGELVPHAGRAKEYLGDANDAMDTLSGISDEDARNAGTALVALTWIVIGLCGLAIALVFFDTVNGHAQRGRVIGALVLTIIVAALAVAIRLGCGMVVFEANDEVGRSVTSLAYGATAMPVAASVAVASAIALLVMRARPRARANLTAG
jgi:hypothetical protein